MNIKPEMRRGFGKLERLQQRYVRFSTWEILLRGWVLSTSHSSLWDLCFALNGFSNFQAVVSLQCLSQCLEPGATPVISVWSRVHLQVTPIPSTWESAGDTSTLALPWAAGTLPVLWGQRSPPDPGGSTANPALHSATMCPCCPCPVQLNKWMFFISWPSLN